LPATQISTRQSSREVQQVGQVVARNALIAAAGLHFVEHRFDQPDPAQARVRGPLRTRIGHFEMRGRAEDHALDVPRPVDVEADASVEA
jgi:hypothetical protein